MLVELCASVRARLHLVTETRVEIEASFVELVNNVIDRNKVVVSILLCVRQLGASTN